MPTAQYGLSLSGGGVSIQKTVNRTGDHFNAFEVALPAGKAVTAWVKTDADTAECNLPSGHGYGASGTFDVYFAAGVRYGVPGTISTNALSLDGGAGADFPASAASDVVVCKQVAISGSIDGDQVQILGLCAEVPTASASTKAHLNMQDGSAASIEAITLTANQPAVYDVAGGASNVFTGNIIEAMKASNGSATEAATLKIISLEDSTP